MPIASDIAIILRDWGRKAEELWYDIPGQRGLGCYGTGYNHWGVQTNQKYLSAMATLAALGDGTPGLDRQWALERALSALRFSLASHVSGPLTCTDGTRWGHTWISPLGIERMMFAVGLLAEHLTDRDRDDLRRMLVSEADWLLTSHQKGPHKDVFADVWNHTGRNAPESNLWDGALLWRTAVMYGDHPRAADWKHQAHRFLLNAVSVAADAADERLIAGKPLRQWHVGANFFPHYALDHHAYTNVGYMVICVSNAAMLHFDLKAAGLDRPESLDHHQADLWNVLRRMIFADGRLARIGGDTRIRYVYCQDYLLPALHYAADRLGDAHARELAQNLVTLFKTEYDHNGDGSFFGRRMAQLRSDSPYYYSRLESDRACVLAMAWQYGRQTCWPAGPAGTFEQSAGGLWHEDQYGAAMHRCPTRLASFAWRAHGLTQAMCQPPGDGHLAEWSQNLTGVVRFLGDSGVVDGGTTNQRKLLAHEIRPFDGGFITWGTVKEGMALSLPEGWSGTDSATHQMVFVALPDGHTTVGMSYCRAAARRVYLAEVKGLHLNVPNDLYNGFARTLHTASGSRVLTSPPARGEVLGTGSVWANVDGRLGVVGLYGGEEISVYRSPNRRGGKFASLYVEELCYPCRAQTHDLPAGAVILDAAWAALSGVSADQTARFAAENAQRPLTGLGEGLRGVRVAALDARTYVVLANVGDQAVEVDASRLAPAGKGLVHLADGTPCGQTLTVPAASAMVLAAT